VNELWDMRNFRNLDIWKDAIDIAVETYEATQDFPKEEEFGLKSQLRRASVSISFNIAEGSSRSSDREYVRFLEIAEGSAFEVETQLIVSTRVRVLASIKSEKLMQQIQSLQRRINSLIQKIRKDMN
jgi:four helix bundle protein